MYKARPKQDIADSITGALRFTIVALIYSKYYSLSIHHPHSFFSFSSHLTNRLYKAAQSISFK